MTQERMSCLLVMLAAIADIVLIVNVIHHW
jgi:hypothetical protein